MADVLRAPLVVNRRDFPPVLQVCAGFSGTLLTTTLAVVAAVPFNNASAFPASPQRRAIVSQTSAGTPKTLFADVRLPFQAQPGTLLNRPHPVRDTSTGSPFPLVRITPPAPFVPVAHLLPVRNWWQPADSSKGIPKALYRDVRLPFFNPPGFYVERVRQSPENSLGSPDALILTIPAAPFKNPPTFAPSPVRPVYDTSRGTPKTLFADKQLPFFVPSTFQIARVRHSYDTSKGTSLALLTAPPPSATVTARMGSWIRYKIIGPYNGPDPNTDLYWANVTLLVQDGTNGGTVITDRSSYASTSTITSGATFENSHQVFSNNSIQGTVPGPTIPSFSSSGVGSRFSRPSSEDTTVECYFYWTSLQNVAPSAYFWQWNDSVAGRIAELGTSGNAGLLRFRINNNSATFPATLGANTLHFIQLTISGNTYYLDVNGSQVETGTFPAHNNAATYDFYVNSSNSPNGSGASSYWVSPLRVTKGIARARGSSPTLEFPTS